MKAISFLLFIGLLWPNYLSAQLTLERNTGNGFSKTIKLGARIGIQLPTATHNKNCNWCYHKFEGYLDSTSTDFIVLNLKNTERLFVDVDGIEKINWSEYRNKAYAPTSFPLNTIESITVYKESSDTMKKWGLSVMAIAVFQSLVFNPFVFEGTLNKPRKKADRVALAAFGIGLGFALVPSKRVYRFKQPLGRSYSLWRLRR